MERKPPMRLNRELCKKLGICWHEWVGRSSGMECTKCGGRVAYHTSLPPNPDFTTDAGKVQLLREMEKREDWEEFQGSMCVGVLDNRVWSWGFPADLILDETGKLAQLALDWLKEGK